jgi:hypothetical protein
MGDNIDVVSGHFESEHPSTLRSPNGAAPSGDLVVALADSPSAGRYAALNVPPPPRPVIGHVVKVDGHVTVIRNGVSIILNDGDVVFKGDSLRVYR